MPPIKRHPLPSPPNQRFNHRKILTPHEHSLFERIGMDAKQKPTGDLMAYWWYASVLRGDHVIYSVTSIMYGASSIILRVIRLLLYVLEATLLRSASRSAASSRASSAASAASAAASDRCSATASGAKSAMFVRSAASCDCVGD
ncbi:hypothetical protein HGRIS_000183 [Hohenbuehelia grisea]|uniref:Uncharacterized protein n=1 Tax=Hohenbuehelia grisea TaxID=104357 RepID=A0ABR3JQB2_9AGAR